MLGSPASRAHLPQAAADSIKQNLQMCPGRRAVGIFTGTEVDGHVERLPASHPPSGRKASGVQGSQE